ncbi:FliH/SctL family protein [Paludibacterium paludis]|uniref:Flagellar assembly protein FliH n=1 Tax=Paludibacterium paludis TaxID=1225769 RepID=A0A918P701_9NEIS|nr:FliH/SctL family protein [Paludibacterium paludis]GGY28851.1 hypothetical protein GCM10011289_35030 [Paludibacterium paludis]
MNRIIRAELVREAPVPELAPLPEMTPTSAMAPETRLADEAEAWRLRMQSEGEAIRQSAYREGFEKGRDEALAAAAKQAEAEERERVERLGRLDALLAAVPASVARAESELEAALMPLLFAALAKILGEHGRQGEWISAAIQQALAQYRGRDAVEVRLHPQDLAELARFGKDGVSQAADTALTLVADPSVTGGGCVLVTGKGEWDAQLTTQFDALRRALLGALRE